MTSYLKMFTLLWQFFDIEVPLLGFTILECMIGNLLICVAIFIVRNHVPALGGGLYETPHAPRISRQLPAGKQHLRLKGGK